MRQSGGIGALAESGFNLLERERCGVKCVECVIPKSLASRGHARALGNLSTTGLPAYPRELRVTSDAH